MAYYTASGLADRGFNVTVITRKVSGSLPSQQRLQGMNVYRYTMSGKNPVHFLLHTRFQLKSVLDRISQQNGSAFDLLIVHQPLAAAVLMRHPTVRHVPWLYNFHSPWAEEFIIKYGEKFLLPNPLHHGLKKGSAILNWIEKKVLNRSSKIIVLSRFMHDRVNRLHGLGGKTAIIPGCVDTGAFTLSEDRTSLRRAMRLPQDKIILFTVRNLRQRMGLENLVRAAGGLNGLKEKVHFVISGKGELESRLKRRAEELKVSRLITFTGRVSEENLKNYYQAADLFVLPTEKLEGFGMVTLEALSSGLPVIATPVGASPEILTRVGQDWMCADSSAEALASKIAERVRWITKHPNEYACLRTHCRQLACQVYDWPIVVRQWAEVCREVMDG